jgi:hypothetical protein
MGELKTEFEKAGQSEKGDVFGKWIKSIDDYQEALDRQAKKAAEKL